jgi:hypothetical protein
VGELGLQPLLATTDFHIHNDHDISFNDQSWHLAYGVILDHGLNEVLAEKMDPFADSLGELISSLVPCNEVGGWLKDEIDFGSKEIFGTACAGAVDQAAKRILPLEVKDIETDLIVNGDARYVEQDGDRKVDGLRDGEWEGTFRYPSETVRLRRPAQTFFGNRSRSHQF